MITVDLAKYPKPTESLIQLALADWVQWWRVTAVPNLCLWHEMDFAVLTRAGLVWEFEIKVTQSDWNRDHLKDRRPTLSPTMEASLARMPEGDQPGQRDYYRNLWTRGPRNQTHVARFYYVYADGLKAPDWVKPDVGLIRAYYEETQHYGLIIRLQEVRPATARKVPKISEKARQKFDDAIYARYWRQLKGIPAHQAEPALRDDP